MPYQDKIAQVLPSLLESLLINDYTCAQCEEAEFRDFVYKMYEC